MKYRFIIDLNVAWCAQTLKDDKGRDTTDCLKLLTEIVGRCHSIVVCLRLHTQYSDLADALKAAGDAQGPSVFSLFSAAWSIEGKWNHITEPPGLANEEAIPEDDRPLVRLALSAGAHLVTCDGRLKTALKQTEVLTKAGLRALGVREALELVMAN